MSGSPSDRGRAHGSACQALIHEGIGRLKQGIRDMLSVDADAHIREYIARTRFAEAIDRFMPGLLDEVRGIGEGAGVDYETILAWQTTGDEFSWYNRDYRMGLLPAGACTSLGVFGQPGMPTLVAQNMDLPRLFEGLMVVQHIREEETGAEAVVPTYAGGVALNSQPPQHGDLLQHARAVGPST